MNNTPRRQAVWPLLLMAIWQTVMFALARYDALQWRDLTIRQGRALSMCRSQAEAKYKK
jgi:hypothetical protein